MKYHLLSRLFSGLAILTFATGAHAALQGRYLGADTSHGYDAYYDTVLNVTWLADANYANTQYLAAPDQTAFINNIISGVGGSITSASGVHVLTASDFGGMAYGGGDWYAAKAWAMTLNVDGYTGWSLPSEVGSGSNADPANQLAYNFTVNLGLTPTSGSSGSNLTLSIPGATGGVIKNLNFPGMYWSGTEFTLASGVANTFVAGPGFDYQGIGGEIDPGFTWAVHAGDIGVATVPLPAAVWLFGSGLLGLVSMARRKAV